MLRILCFSGIAIVILFLFILLVCVGVHITTNYD